MANTEISGKGNILDEVKKAGSKVVNAQGDHQEKTVMLVVAAVEFSLSLLIKGGQEAVALFKKDKMLLGSKDKQNTTKETVPEQDIPEESGEKQAKTSKSNEMTMEQLRAQGKDLEQVKIAREDLKVFRNFLKKENVDFSVFKDKNSDKFHVFFKGKDKNSIMNALEKSINSELIKGKVPMKEQLEKAQNTAKERNAAMAQEKEQNRGMEKTKQRDVQI